MIFVYVQDGVYLLFFFFSSRRRHTRLQGDWSSDVCSSDLEHLLAELIDQKDGAVRPTLEAAKISVDQLKKTVEARLKQLPKMSGAKQQTALSSTLRQILDNAEREAERLQDQFVSTEHLLLSMLDPAVPSEAG